MQRFRWLSTGTIPPAYDLRRCGWTLAADRDADGRHGAAVCLADLTVAPPLPEATVAVGIADPGERARLLGRGFGDALGDCELRELAARARRLGGWGPRYRRHEALELDLVAREASCAGKPLNLHPREFGLLWRLLATPGEIVPKASLLREVWRLRHLPETNSLAVHACRLRGKLAAAGLVDLIRTEADGYQIPARAPAHVPAHVPALPLPADDGTLAPDLRLTSDPPLCETVRPMGHRA